MVKYIIYAIIISKTHQRERGRDGLREKNKLGWTILPLLHGKSKKSRCLDNLRDAGPSSSRTIRDVPDIPRSVHFDTVVYIQYDIVRGREAHPANGC